MSWWRKLLGWGEGGEEKKGHSHAARMTPEQEFQIARQAFEIEGNPQHALHHLAEAVADDPTDPARLELLDQILTASGADPDQVLGENDRGYYATEALRAYALQRQAKTGEALELLLAIARAKSDAPFLEAWALDWLEDEEAWRTVDPDRIAYLAAIAVIQYPEHRELRARPRTFLERLIALLDRVRAARAVDVAFRMWRTAVLRKLGRFEEAMKEANTIYQEQPQWQTAVAVANVHRHSGNLDEGIAWFKKAVEHDPTDVSARNDIADLYLERDDYENALRWYDEVLQRQKDHPWALPSAHYCRLRLTNDEPWIRRLVELTNGPEPNERAGNLLNLFHPYVGYLPEPTDASANVLRQLSDAVREKPEDWKGAGDVELTVSCLESPSNVLAFARQMQALGSGRTLKTTAQSVPKPDPRQPLAPVEYLLWEYDGNDAEPALPPPSKEIAELTAALASRRYDYWSNWNEAGVIAERLGTERIDELLAVMVNPPPIRGEVSALVWIPRVQLAAAQMIAQIDEGWQGSLRRRVLLDIARGPRDWATEAAIVALAQLAQFEKNPAITAEARQAFQQLLDAQPNSGHCAYMHALLSNWLFLPDLPDRERKKIRKLLDDWNK
jgi:tetratricopeptide (TPR) repeat protein